MRAKPHSNLLTLRECDWNFSFADQNQENKPTLVIMDSHHQIRQKWTMSSMGCMGVSRHFPMWPHETSQNTQPEDYLYTQMLDKLAGSPRVTS